MYKSVYNMYNLFAECWRCEGWRNVPLGGSPHRQPPQLCWNTQSEELKSGTRATSSRLAAHCNCSQLLSDRGGRHGWP